jgi:hypothetical protein
MVVEVVPPKMRRGGLVPTLWEFEFPPLIQQFDFVVSQQRSGSRQKGPAYIIALPAQWSPFRGGYRDDEPSAKTVADLGELQILKGSPIEADPTNRGLHETKLHHHWKSACLFKVTNDDNSKPLEPRHAVHAPFVDIPEKIRRCREPEVLRTTLDQA